MNSLSSIKRNYFTAAALAMMFDNFPGPVYERPSPKCKPGVKGKPKKMKRKKKGNYFTFYR